jgi:hypothetical protein
MACALADDLIRLPTDDAQVHSASAGSRLAVSSSSIGAVREARLIAFSRLAPL